ncbi:MAG: hemopexin repeat-containing protein, partial [Actinomycetes bacterium]
PRDIAAHWGGLSDVAIAFVDGDLTYVCESPDADGAFRYVVYSGTDYTQPDPGYPRTAGADFWGIPQAWRDEGFARIAAVLVDRGNRIFLTGTRFVQHTAATGAWSLPHPLSRLWPDLPFGDDATAVESAFVGADGTTYLFAHRRFVGHNGTRPTAPAPIEKHWGHVANNFAAPTRGTLVDAAFVDGGTTYLFSGDQFVRYSGADYRYVDTGYPKPIGELRQEECFANLPDEVENLLADRVATGAETIVDAVVGNPRTVTLFVGADAHVVSRTLEGTLEQAGLGRVRNTLADTGRVDASFVAGDHTFLFAGDQYVRYTGDRYADVDEGYPRAIETALPADIGVAALPAPFVDGIDAALAGIDGRIHLFAGPLFLT